MTSFRDLPTERRVDVQCSFKRAVQNKYAVGRRVLGLSIDTADYTRKASCRASLARAWEAAQIAVDDKFGYDLCLSANLMRMPDCTLSLYVMLQARFWAAHHRRWRFRGRAGRCGTSATKDRRGGGRQWGATEAYISAGPEQAPQEGPPLVPSQVVRAVEGVRGTQYMITCPSFQSILTPMDIMPALVCLWL